MEAVIIVLFDSRYFNSNDCGTRQIVGCLCLGIKAIVTSITHITIWNLCACLDNKRWSLSLISVASSDIDCVKGMEHNASHGELCVDQEVIHFPRKRRQRKVRFSYNDLIIYCSHLAHHKYLHTFPGFQKQFWWCGCAISCCRLPLLCRWCTSPSNTLYQEEASVRNMSIPTDDFLPQHAALIGKSSEKYSHNAIIRPPYRRLNFRCSCASSGFESGIRSG